jgi:hypothetical protein
MAGERFIQGAEEEMWWFIGWCKEVPWGDRRRRRRSRRRKGSGDGIHLPLAGEWRKCSGVTEGKILTWNCWRWVTRWMHFERYIINKLFKNWPLEDNQNSVVTDSLLIKYRCISPVKSSNF